MVNIGFFIKKIITFFVEPLGLVMTLFALGLVFLYLKKDKFAKSFLLLSFVLLFLFSFPPFANFLTKSLENQYPKYSYDAKISYIHVLGGGHNTDKTQPISSHLGNASTKRVLEGIIIYKNTDDAKLIFTGYEEKTDISTAHMNAELALALGVPREDIIINGVPKDTAEEALFTKSIVGDNPFALVTSASHMVRSMMLFKKLGMNPIPAPTYFQKTDTFYVAPSIDALENSRMVIHEYLGILWAKIKS